MFIFVVTTTITHTTGKSDSMSLRLPSGNDETVSTQSVQRAETLPIGNNQVDGYSSQSDFLPKNKRYRDPEPAKVLYNFSAMMLRWIKIFVICFFIYLVQQQDIRFSIGFSPKNELKPVNQPMYTTFSIGERPSAVPAEEAEQPTWQPLDPDLLTDDQVFDYLNRFEKVAKAEMKKFGIPASIKLAMGILESHADTNPLTLSTNNHFGQHFHGQVFKSAWENWRRHSILLKENYPQLFRNGLDSEKWIAGLKQSHYSTDPFFYKKLTEVVGRYDLDRFNIP